MALSKTAKLLYAIAAFLPFTHAGPPSIQEDNDDTPLPLVIWHGKSRHYHPAHPPPPYL